MVLFPTRFRVPGRLRLVKPILQFAGWLIRFVWFMINRVYRKITSTPESDPTRMTDTRVHARASGRAVSAAFCNFN